MIDRSQVLDAINELWNRYPHWRFGQLIANVAGWADQPIWDVEDDQLLNAVRSHLEHHTASENGVARDLVRAGNHRYGQDQSDIREELLRYSQLNGYATEHFADAKCDCGSTLFRLMLDDGECAAVRICRKCGDEHPIGDSDAYLEGAVLQECECPCGGETFEITVGVSLYQDSEDVRWLYVGCRCPECNLIGTYGDWKNEYIGYREFLDRV